MATAVGGAAASRAAAVQTVGGEATRADAAAEARAEWAVRAPMAEAEVPGVAFGRVVPGRAQCPKWPHPPARR